MFTGIIETIGTISFLEKDAENLHLTIESDLANDLSIDQSIAHNGVCLTVVDIMSNSYKVTAIKETLDKTNLGFLKVGDGVNLERAMRLGQRLDGHIVQGHVDQTAICVGKSNQEGSWVFTFEYDQTPGNITIEKGSVTVDGTSLTVVDSRSNTFKVAIIPYTYEHTQFKSYEIGSVVNLEFDVIGKYVARLMNKN